MMRSTFRWNGPDALQVGIDASWEGIQAAAIYFENAVKIRLNVSNPRPHTTPSRPGEPPRKRTGSLQGNIRHEFDRDRADNYERDLREIGRLIGCDHLDDGLARCIADAIEGKKR